MRVRDGADIAATEQEMRDLLRQRHKLQPSQEDDFSIRNLSEVLAAQEASSRILALLLAAIASVSLLVGGIGIMNIMLVSVTERTREIGLRMAVGARGRDILTQFLVEAVTLALIGGLVGILLGAVASYAVGHFAGWRTEMSAALGPARRRLLRRDRRLLRLLPGAQCGPARPDRRAAARVSRGVHGLIRRRRRVPAGQRCRSVPPVGSYRCQRRRLWITVQPRRSPRRGAVGADRSPGRTP